MRVKDRFLGLMRLFFMVLVFIYVVIKVSHQLPPAGHFRTHIKKTELLLRCRYQLSPLSMSGYHFHYLGYDYWPWLQCTWYSHWCCSCLSRNGMFRPGEFYIAPILSLSYSPSLSLFIYTLLPCGWFVGHIFSSAPLQNNFTFYLAAYSVPLPPSLFSPKIQ